MSWRRYDRGVMWDRLCIVARFLPPEYLSTKRGVISAAWPDSKLRVVDEHAVAYLDVRLK